METRFDLLDDRPETFAKWKALIVATGIAGTDCFDIRFAAIMQVYGIANLLTFNAADFSAAPGIPVERSASL